VPTENFPLHRLRMRDLRREGGYWAHRWDWMERNDAVRRSILEKLAEGGPLPARELDDPSIEPWESSGWTGGQTVERMLAFLWAQGEILVARRTTRGRLWDLPERVLPAEVLEADDLPTEEIVRRAVQISLRALGVATPRQIAGHFTRGHYPDLAARLAELEAGGVVLRAEVGRLRGDWYVHADDVPLLERLRAGEWEPRTVLLSPFDNLVADRERTELLWDFAYRIEIYVPKAKRRYGYYVLPILHGDRLVGRVDPAFDRKRRILRLNAVYAEPDAPAAGRAIGNAVAELAAFVGAEAIEYPKEVPRRWARSLRTR
jgi:uncharacterized protein